MIETAAAPNPTFRGAVIHPDDRTTGVGSIRLSTDILEATTRHDRDLTMHLSIAGPRGRNLAWLELSEEELRGLHAFLSQTLAELGTMRAEPSYVDRLRDQVAEYAAKYTR